MATIAVVAAEVGVIYPDQAEVGSMIAAVTITAGQLLYVNSSGAAALADGNVAGAQQCRALALEGGGAGQSIQVLWRGMVEGFTITQAYDAIGYVSDTAGVLDDAAGTLTVEVGIVRPIADGKGTPSKAFFFNPRNRGDFS